MLSIGFVYIDQVTLLKRIKDKRVRRSIYIKSRVDCMKLSRLTRLQISNINSYLKKEELFLRVAILGNNVWEIWYAGGE